MLRKGRYHRKTACAAVVFGSAGAVPGSLFALSLSAAALNVLLLLMLLAAIVITLRS